jgi:hypothetical protein
MSPEHQLALPEAALSSEGELRRSYAIKIK